MNIKNILILFLFIVLLYNCDLFTHISEDDYLYVKKDKAEIAEIEFAYHSRDDYWSKYWTFDTVNGSIFYVWYHDGGGTGDPGPIGSRIGISVSAPLSASISEVIDNTVIEINNIAGTEVSAANTSATFFYLLLSQKFIGSCTDASSGTLNNSLTVRILQNGQYGD